MPHLVQQAGNPPSERGMAKLATFNKSETQIVVPSSPTPTAIAVQRPSKFCMQTVWMITPKAMRGNTHHVVVAHRRCTRVGARLWKDTGW